MVTESYHRAWVMMESGPTIDLRALLSGCLLGESFGPQAERTVPEGLFLHLLPLPSGLSEVDHSLSPLALEEESHPLGSCSDRGVSGMDAGWDQNPDPRLGTWGDRLKHLGEHVDQKRVCANPAKPAS